jgi:two-component system cell cycle sensor histidine kinase/response regulator CckA
MSRAHVLADQVETLYRQTVVVLVANCVNTAIVSALLWKPERRPLLLGWMAVTLLLSAARFRLYWRYQRAARENAQLWGSRFAWASALSGLAWGGASLILLEGSEPIEQLVVIFFAGGMCAAAAGTLASYLPAFVAFAVPALFGLVAALATFGDAPHHTMAAGIVLFGAGLFAVARVNHRALSQAFRLRFENTELLATLQQTQRELEENNRTLEQRVKERGEALRRQAEALVDGQRLAALGRLAGGIAHDFNNLLTVVLANASELLDTRKFDLKTRSALLEMREAARRGADLVRQLLAFSRQQRTSPEDVDLNLTVQNMQTWMGRLLGAALTLRIRLHPEALFVRMDPTQLEQVIVNLITNARDAVGGGGNVTIETEIAQLDVDSGELPSGCYAVLSVTDNGTGMDAETRRHIFEPFFTTKELGKGTGLGLATSHGIVDQGGGKILVSSEPGRGSCFRVHLPLVSRAASADRRVPTTSELRHLVPATPAVTILLAEDEPAIRRLTQRILGRAGHHVLAAESAEAALELCERHPGHIDLLITDVVMPGMDGPALAARLAPIHPRMRTLFISGYSGDRALPLEPGADGAAFLAKPFTRESLLACVTALLGARGDSAAKPDPAAGAGA